MIGTKYLCHPTTTLRMDNPSDRLEIPSRPMCGQRQVEEEEATGPFIADPNLRGGFVDGGQPGQVEQGPPPLQHEGVQEGGGEGADQLQRGG